MKYMDYLFYIGTTAPYSKFYGVLDFIILVDPNNEEEIEYAIETLELYRSREYCHDIPEYAKFIAKYGNTELFRHVTKEMTWLNIEEVVKPCKDFMNGRIQSLPAGVDMFVGYIVNAVVTEYAHMIAKVYRERFAD